MRLAVEMLAPDVHLQRESEGAVYTGREVRTMAQSTRVFSSKHRSPQEYLRILAL